MPFSNFNVASISDVLEANCRPIQPSVETVTTHVKMMYQNELNTAIPNKSPYLGFKDFLQELRAIPAGALSVDLSSNYLRQYKNVTEWLQIFATLPRGLTHLNLEKNQFGLLDKEFLITAFNTLPPHLTSINLGGNQLHHFSINELTEILRALPPHIKEIDLRGNDFENSVSKNSTYCDHIISIVKALSNAHKIIFDKLSILTTNDLIRIIEASKECKEFDLSKGLDLFSQTNILRILKAFPKNITALDLSSNGLYKFLFDPLLEIISSLPSQLASLSLRDVGLDHFTPAELCKLMYELPKNLQYLDLRQNALEHLTLHDWQNIFKTLPQNLNTLHLNFYDICELTIFDFLIFIDELPSSIDTLLIDGKKLNIIGFTNACFMLQIDRELLRLQNEINPLLAQIGVSQNVHREIQGLKELRGLFTHRKEKNEEFKTQLQDWRRKYNEVFLKQRNNAHSFFTNTIKPTSSLLLAELSVYFGVSVHEHHGHNVEKGMVLN